MGGRGSAASSETVTFTPMNPAKAPTGGGGAPVEDPPLEKPREDIPRRLDEIMRIREPSMSLDAYESVWTDKPDYEAFRVKSDETFAEKLTPSQRAALASYKGTGYRSLNSQLRGHYEMTQNSRDKAKKLDAAFKNQQLGKDLKLYRGFDTKQKLDVGMVFTDKGFISTSLNPNGAFGGNTFFRIHAPKTTKGAFIDTLRTYDPKAPKGKLRSTEHEVLLARGTSFKIVGKGTLKNKYGSVQDVWDVVVVKQEASEL